MRFGVFFSTLAAALIGFGTGAVTMRLFTPDLIDARLPESLPDQVTARIIASGAFSGASTIHRAEGTAEILEGDGLVLVRFRDFRVSNGPNLQVWLVRAADVADSRDLRASDVLSLGPLKRVEGDQIYFLPRGLAIADFPLLVVWDEQFGALYATARFAG